MSNHRTHAATVLLVMATVLLLITCFSAPIIRQLGFVVVKSKARGDMVRLGAFGFCHKAGFEQCSRRKLGYPVTDALQALVGMGQTAAPQSIDRLTYGLVMHPIATILSVLGMLIAVLSHRFGFIFASVMTCLAFLSSVAAMAVDFSLLAHLKYRAREYPGALHASHGAGIWMTLTATILLFIATFACIMQCMCGTSRRKEQLQA